MQLNKSFLKIVLLVTVSLVGMSSVNPNQNDRLFEITKNIEVFANLFKEVNKNYVDQVDPGELMRIGIDAMVKSLDPFTNYISETQVERYRISDDSKYQGVGADIVKKGSSFYIDKPREGGPAHGAGLRAGDELLEVDGNRLDGKSEEDIKELIKGVAGTPVSLKIKKAKGGNTEDLSLERGEVNISNVPYSGYIRDGIGYINLTTFTANASANILKAFKSLKEEDPNMKGLIIDLRNNGGGLLREALSICNLFLPKGTELVTTKSKTPEDDQNYKAIATPEDLDIPISVLINKSSASASEIVSGVMQDMDRGVVVGQRSYGKGLVQNTFDLPYNNRVKVTISRYHIPSGRCIQGVEYDNGEPVDIPDSKRSKFKTKNGRTVLDGGGVTPDVKLPKPTVSEFTNALLDQKIIFDYATKYVLSKDSIEDLQEFNFTDYSDFMAYAKQQNVVYKLPGEEKVEELTSVLEKNSSLQSTLKPVISNLIAKYKEIKSDDFSEYKDEVVNEIEKEIASRYFFEKGRIQINLRNDVEVDEAVKLLLDDARYNKILKN